MIYDKHIFVCTNERTSSDTSVKLRTSCGEAHGLALTAEFKKQLKDLPVKLNARANKCGCLGICDFGPTVAIYPEGIFYVGVKTEDVKEIIEEHIVKGNVVERLVLKR